MTVGGSPCLMRSCSARGGTKDRERFTEPERMPHTASDIKGFVLDDPDSSEDRISKEQFRRIPLANHFNVERLFKDHLPVWTSQQQQQSSEVLLKTPSSLFPNVKKTADKKIKVLQIMQERRHVRFFVVVSESESESHFIGQVSAEKQGI